MSSCSFQFIHFNSFVSNHSFQVIHVNAFISSHSYQVLHANAFISCHWFQVSHSIILSFVHACMHFISFHVMSFHFIFMFISFSFSISFSFHFLFISFHFNFIFILNFISCSFSFSFNLNSFVWIPSCQFIRFKSFISCISFHFNSLLSNSPKIPIGKLVPIAGSIFETSAPARAGHYLVLLFMIIILIIITIIIMIIIIVIIIYIYMYICISMNIHTEHCITSRIIACVELHPYHYICIRSITLNGVCPVCLTLTCKINVHPHLRTHTHTKKKSHLNAWIHRPMNSYVDPYVEALVPQILQDGRGTTMQT